MRIGKLKVNHVKESMGFDLGKPVFSWIVLQSTGSCQKEARLVAGLDEALSQIVYDSGRTTGLLSLGTEAEFELSPRTRYYWQVEVWADDGDTGVSPISWFETGKMEEVWSAAWIAAPFDKDIHPYLNRKFQLEEDVCSARAYVCGLGLYEMEINGQKVGEEYLMPGYLDYGRWLQYQTYDITDLLQKGSNAAGAMLGNGWYKGRFGFVPDMKELYGDRMKFLCEIRVTMKNGRELVVGTDESWNCYPSPVLESSIYNGEVYDSRQQVPNWSESGCDDGNWQPADQVEPPQVLMKERLSPPLLICEQISPRELIHTPAGELVLDFGQEMTGWMEFPCQEAAGSEIFLQYGEILQNGNFYNENLRTAKAEFRYIADGVKRWVRPHFTFYGFRYVKVTGLTEEEMLAAKGSVIHSALEETGHIETSSPDINRLFLNALWGQKGNFLDVPTDCPQRDERMGWTGDAQVFSATATFNMDTAAFYRKYLYDMLLAQRDLGGAVPDVVPDALGRIHEIRNDDGRSAGACAWADAATVIPWTLYLFYGDKSLLESQFENMHLWVDSVKKLDEEQCGGQRLWTCGFHYGDWLALDNPDKESRFGGTDNGYTASCYYYYSALLTARAAGALKKEKEAEYYGKLAEEVKAAIGSHYFTDKGEITIHTQTALVLALYLDLVPQGEGYKERLVAELKERLDARDIHLDTGFIGTPWLCPVLSQNGLQDYAYTLLFNEDYPSWLYEIRMGATTIWERWNSVLLDGSISDTGMNSLNHYAYGSIVEWMYRYLCGINPVWEHPGFQKVVLRPQTDSRLTWAEGSYHSPMGEYRCRWERQEEKTVYHIRIPFGSCADFIPNDQTCQVKVDEREIVEVPAGGGINLSTGSYEITVWNH